MKYVIPYYYQIAIDGQIISTNSVTVEYSKKEIKEIIDFISENEYYDCELVNLPGHVYDDLMADMEFYGIRFLNKNHIEGDQFTYNPQAFLPPELVKLFPDDLKEKLNTKDYFKNYGVKTMDELLSLCAEEEPAAPKKQYKEGTYMKTLAIRQPWASLIAMGIKDIECRDAMPTKCRKIFIAASGAKVKWNDLEDYVQRLILDLEKAGKMPAYKNWPKKCIIGHADIVKVGIEPVESIWGRDWPGMKYTLRNAEVLDEPLYGLNKATPYFYNVEGYSEQNLPKSHKVDLTGIDLPK